MNHRVSGTTQLCYCSMKGALQWCDWTAVQCCILRNLFTKAGREVDLAHRQELADAWTIVHCCCCLATKSRPALLRPHGLMSVRLLCPRNSHVKNAGVGCHFLLQGSNLRLLHWQVDSSSPSHQGSQNYSVGSRKFLTPALNAPPVLNVVYWSTLPFQTQI